MKIGPKRLDIDLFLNTNLTFVSKWKKSDGTILIDTADVTNIELKVYNIGDSVATGTPLITRSMVSNPLEFIIDNTNKQVVFDVQLDGLPLGRFKYVINATKTAWTETKPIYAGIINKNDNVGI